MTIYTVSRWIFNQKQADVSIYDNEIMDCTELKNGMPVDMKTAKISVVNVLRETEKAVNIEVELFEGKTWRIWMPKSQIVNIEEAA